MLVHMKLALKRGIFTPCKGVSESLLTHLDIFINRWIDFEIVL